MGHLAGILAQLGAILTLSWPIVEPILPQPVLLLAHLMPVCAHLGRIQTKRNPKRNEKASEYQWLLTIFPVSTKARNIKISCLNAILGHLCDIVAQFSGILAPSWPHPGLSWSRSWLNLCFFLLVHLKPVFARLGRILAHLGTEIPNSWQTNGFEMIFQIKKRTPKLNVLVLS